MPQYCEILEDPRYKGKMVMLLGKIDSNPDCEKFIEEL